MYHFILKQLKTIACLHFLSCDLVFIQICWAAWWLCVCLQRLSYGGGRLVIDFAVHACRICAHAVSNVYLCVVIHSALLQAASLSCAFSSAWSCLESSSSKTMCLRFWYRTYILWFLQLSFSPFFKKKYFMMEIRTECNSLLFLKAIYLSEISSTYELVKLRKCFFLCSQKNLSQKSKKKKKSWKCYIRCWFLQLHTATSSVLCWLHNFLETSSH